MWNPTRASEKNASDGPGPVPPMKSVAVTDTNVAATRYGRRLPS